MKKNLQVTPIRALCICFIIFSLFTVNSCRKDLVPFNARGAIGSLPENEKVHPAEVLSWLNKTMPAEEMGQVQLNNAKQSLINKKHVVKIPIGKDAALFFTKVNGDMQVYAYKWLNTTPTAKTYSGYINAYSFQSNTAKQLVYKNGKLVKQSYLQINESTKTIEPVHGPNVVSIFDYPLVGYTSHSNNYSFSIFGQFWCWLTGGNYVTQDDIDNGYSYGANGESGMTGCDYAGVAEQDDGNGGTPDANGDYTLNNGVYIQGSPGDVTGSGSSGGSGGSTNNSGDGLLWVYIPSPDGCTVTDENGNSGLDPNGNCGGYWMSYSMFTTPDVIADPVNDSSNADDTDDSGNVVDVDCSSFTFIKTSIANWQEAGVNNIRLKWVWIGGSNSGMSRTIFLPSIVFGLPTQYQNNNGSVTYLSAGQAAVKAAKITEIAKDYTYTEFRNSPYSPSDAEVLIYLKKQLTILMATQRGTAGATGSGSSNIIFNEEQRSSFFPYNCGN